MTLYDLQKNPFSCGKPSSKDHGTVASVLPPFHCFLSSYRPVSMVWLMVDLSHSSHILFCTHCCNPLMGFAWEPCGLRQFVYSLPCPISSSRNHSCICFSIFSSNNTSFLMVFFFWCLQTELPPAMLVFISADSFTTLKILCWLCILFHYRVYC